MRAGRILVLCVIAAAIASIARAADSSAAPPATPPETRLTFLGAASAMPGPGEDTACFIINGTFLVDCGFNVGLNMQRYGYSPLKIETLFFTHCHHDHYMGLPGLLFIRGMRKAQGSLKIVGPPDDLPIVVDAAKNFIQAERFPNVWPKLELSPLEPGKTYETEQFKIETVKSIHPVTGVCSRLTDKASGAIIAFSGDTAFNPPFAKLAKGADVLIHEASVSSKVPDEKMGTDHSRAIDAARIARDAKVKQLILIHLPTSQRDASQAAAREIFPNTIVASEGQTIIFPGRYSSGSAAVPQGR